MALGAGDRLGPYEITALLGAGGMGEVYRAHDVRLGRDVAIKVLPSEFAREPTWLRRFEQEAKAAAALNDPHIVAIFDVGTAERPYVVSELLEGQTLRQALAAGPLPPRTATDIAMQIARGIAAAHLKGIVHRDLKPENIFLTTDGRAKILDFGLAKLAEATSGRSASAVRTTLAPTTTPGTVLGTVGYMAPEQLRGEAADHRADIFALGAVVYEMLSGRRAFARDTAVETMSAILKDDPPELTSDAHVVVPAMERIVRRCLEKNPQQRFQAASDVAYAIEALSGVTAAPGAVSVPAISRWRSHAALIAAAAIGAGVGAVVVRQLTAPARPAVMFEAKTFDRLPVTNARFMPDGDALVFSATRRGSAADLFVLNPNVESPQPLGVSNAHLLSVSSKGELAIIVDARHLGQRLFSGTLARMTIGSSPRPVLDHVREADWSPDGNSLAIVRDLGNGRDRLEYPVGTALYEASGYLSDPRLSPDGRLVAFFEHQSRFDDRGWVTIVDRSSRVTRLTGEFWSLQGLAWTPDGSTVVFSGSATGGSVMQPFAVPVSGRPAQAVFGVPGRLIVLDIGRDGRWLASREDLSFDVRARVPSQAAERDLSWLGSAGARRLSRDGEWLLLVDVGPSGGKNYGVVMRKTDGSRTVRLGEGAAQELSPDGRWALAIVASPPQLAVYPVGTGDAIRITSRPIERYETAQWFPDGKRLFVCGSEPGRSPRCYEQDLAGSPPKPLTPEGVRASLAPDGRLLLLMMPDGSFRVSQIDGADPRAPLALRAGDRHIAWSRDSRAVFVQRGSEIPATIERVDLTTGQRTVAHQIAPHQSQPVSSITVTDWVDGGPWYAYNLTTLSSTLFVVTGAAPAR